MSQRRQRTLSDAQRLTGQWRSDVRFEVQPTTELLRPEGIQPKPHTHGPETALVCGPQADTVQSDINTDPRGCIIFSSSPKVAKETAVPK